MVMNTCEIMLQCWILKENNIIQILTGTVMRYHVSVDCQESYIFPKCAALRENIVPRENITILAPPTRDISWPYRSISVILDGQNEWFRQNILCPMTNTKFGNKTRSLRTKQTEGKLDSFARILLWRSIVDHCVLCLRSAFLSGSFPNMELMLLLLSPLLYLLNCYIFVVASLRLL